MNLVAELEKKITPEMETKYFPKFEKQAAYLGNGVYSIPATNIYSTDTRELFLMFVAAQENISFKQRQVALATNVMRLALSGVEPTPSHYKYNKTFDSAADFPQENPEVAIEANRC